MIITLENEKFKAQVDTAGAQLISLKDNEGTEYIWQRKEPFWEKCAPILFPVVARPMDNKITLNGKDYPMPLHGFAFDHDYEVVKQEKDFLSLKIKSSEKTRTMYPFEFELYVNFTLDDEGIKTEIKVVNTDEKDMLFGVGGHPAINWPLFDGDEYTDYVFKFDKEYRLFSLTSTEDVTIIPDDEYELELDENVFHLSRDIFKYDTIVIEKAPFNSLDFVNKEGKGVRFEFENFKTFAVWSQQNPEPAPFICLEPWTSMGKRVGEDSSLENKKDIVTLAPGKEHVCSYKISPIK